MVYVAEDHHDLFILVRGPGAVFAASVNIGDSNRGGASLRISQGMPAYPAASFVVADRKWYLAIWS